MLLLKNARIVDYDTGKEDKINILIEDKNIVSVSKGLRAMPTMSSIDTINCEGLVAIPGIFDMHVHTRDPGGTHKEDLFTCANAAVAGGVTGFLCMPNTTPVIDNTETIEYIKIKSKALPVKVFIAGAITKKLEGKELCDYDALKKAGVIAITDDGKPVTNSRLMAEAMIKAEDEELTIISHCEDMYIAEGGLMNAGLVSIVLGIDGMHRASENIMTDRELNLARDLYSNVHIAHVSTKESVIKIKAAKAEDRSVKITCEAAPHHFTLTEEKLMSKDADYRMNPPLRLQKDIDAIIEGLRDGTIDCIATDHAPHSPGEKEDFFFAPNGVVGLETSLAVTLTQLYHTGMLKLHDIVRLMCVNPRRILGIEGGMLKSGQIADITIFDPEEEWVVKPENFRSKSRNSCFKGMKLKGRVKHTIIDGKIVFGGSSNG